MPKGGKSVAFNIKNNYIYINLKKKKKKKKKTQQQQQKRKKEKECVPNKIVVSLKRDLIDLFSFFTLPSWRPPGDHFKYPFK